MATHEHAHLHGATGAVLRRAFLLTLVILVVEAVGGMLSHSLALLSDAGHVLTDIVALGLAWFATNRAEKPPDARNTYGYHRTGILVALINAVSLILIVGWIGYEAVGRLRHPESVSPWIMIVAATVGIAINLSIALGLRAEGSANLNARGALLHALGDVGASVGVIIGAVVIALTGWRYADPIISLAIALLIAKGAWDLLGDTVDILMEATPRDINVAQLVRDVIRLPGVEDVHDLHIWSIAGGMRVLSAHVQVADNRPLAACDRLVEEIHTLLCNDYTISHTTLQLECAGCTLRDLYCGLPDHAHSAEDAHEHGEHTHDALPAQRA
jgi:cobalt-zinc-cadmium efflux system protein